MPWRMALLGILVIGTIHFGDSVALADFTTDPQVLTIPLTPTDWGPSTTSLAGSNPLEIQKFDPSQHLVNNQPGILTSVDIRVDYQFENTLSIRFSNISTITVAATASLTLENQNGVTVATSSPFTNSQTLTATAADVGRTIVFPTVISTGSMPGPAGGYVGASTLAHFTGTDTIAFPVVASATSTFTTTSGNGYGSSVTNAEATITIIYHFVPEPSSFVLAGMGVVGLLGFYRKSSRQRGLKAAQSD